ncbi:unnamed protein product [Lampetra planeri]
MQITREAPLLLLPLLMHRAKSAVVVRGCLEARTICQESRTVEEARSEVKREAGEGGGGGGVRCALGIAPRDRTRRAPRTSGLAQGRDVTAT